MARLQDHLAALSGLPTHEALDGPQKIVLGLATQLRIQDVGEVDGDTVLAIENRLMELSNEITLRFFSQADGNGAAAAVEGESAVVPGESD